MDLILIVLVVLLVLFVVGGLAVSPLLWILALVVVCCLLFRFIPRNRQ